MSPRQECERGQVLVLTALFLVVLLLAGALAIDYSSWLVARRDYQAVVDAAALAGASQLPPPGTAAVSSTDTRNAAREALVYLSDHLGWGITRTTVQSITTASFLNNPAPYVPSGSGYCVWIWTPVPPAATPTSAGAQCEPNSSTLYAPATFAGDGHKIFVRVQSLRPAFLGGVAGIQSELVSAIAVGGGAVNNYAVISLKTRLGNPDNVLGFTLNGNTTSLNVPIGNVGGNYSATCSSSSNTGAITFPNSTLDQQIVVNKPPPTATCTNSNVTGGTIGQLADYPIPDPAYFASPPGWCTGPITGQCQETGGVWPYAASSIYPTGCGTPSQNKITNCTGSFTVYPGKYEYVDIPNGATATLSPNCYGDAADLLLYPGHLSPDSNCISNGRKGVYYFYTNSSGGNAGLKVDSGGTLYGCGVLTVFDPNENGASAAVQFLAGTGSVVKLNDPSIPGGCSMKYDNGITLTAGTNYAWYGDNAAFQNPVTMWVRPNGNYGNNGASDVITFTGQADLHEGGAIYAPADNTKISGGPSGSGVGQIVAWTITYSGGTGITESFQGPATVRTRLWQ
jgi:hypothetical protein